MVKADAYGHGAVQTAGHLLEHAGIRDFGVANVTEAQELRAAFGEAAEIELLSPALPAEFDDVVRLRLTPWLSDATEARAFAARASAREPLGVVVEVDTGMGRTGVLPEGLARLVETVRALPGLRLAGIATHLPSADDDPIFTREQLAVFATLLREYRDTLKQTRSSAGILGYSPVAGELVRAGLMLYGVSPLLPEQARLLPVLTWKTRVSLVRDLPAGQGISYGRTLILERATRVATLSAGYADGYPRSLAGQGASVLIRGRRCALLGRVTMDQVMVNADAFPDLLPGEEVVLLGRQESDEISAHELATRAGTIAWEIFTGLSHRVTRVYG